MRKNERILCQRYSFPALQAISTLLLVVELLLGLPIAGVNMNSEIPINEMYVNGFVKAADLQCRKQTILTKI